MGEVKTFYDRYWNGRNIKVNPFDRHPEEWTPENFSYHWNFFKPFVKGKLLDFGCGDGQFLHMINKYCEVSYGVDISEIAIKKAQELAKENNVRINAFVADLETYTLPKDSYEVIACFYYLHF